MLASELMTKEVVTIPADTPVRDVARVLPARGTSVAPVVDGSGILTRGAPTKG